MSVARAWRAATDGPDYPPVERDLATVRIAGLELPWRATVALVVVTLVLLVEYSGWLVPTGAVLPWRDAGTGEAAGAAFARSISRALLFGVVPLAVVLLVFRDDPRRYGLRLGAWRWGLGLLLAGLVVMTPIIVGLSRDAAFAAYYAPFAAPLPALLLTHALDLAPAEFLLRGFLFFTLLRRIGPLAIVVVQLPFVFTHLGKPELELYSTLFGGAVFAWLDWRTGSILWSAIAHVFILTLMIVAAGTGFGAG